MEPVSPPREDRPAAGSEARLRALLDAARDFAVVGMDADGRITDVSEGAERVLGWAQEELIGGDFSTFFTSADTAADVAAHELRRARESGSAIDERWHLRKDGTPFWGSGHTYLVEDGGYVKVFQDRTKEVRADAALARHAATLQDLVSNSPFGVYVVDADFRISAVGEGAMSAFDGIDPIVGRDFGEVQRLRWPEEVAARNVSIFRHTLDTGEPHRESSVLGRQDVDERRAYDWKVERFEAVDGRFALVCRFYDLTATLRQAEAMERRVAERTAELTAANAEMVAFNYSVAHDLRAPLRAISSTSAILIEEIGGGLAEEHLELLRRQAAAAARLSRLLDDLLGLAKAGRQELAVDDVDLAAMTREVYLELAANRPVPCRLMVADPMRARGDSKLIRLVVQNLLDNALKFSPDGGRVTLGEVDGAFFVRDQGVGFLMSGAKRLFMPFERLVNEGAFPGTGIGLANVKRIVERHGGRVWAESEPGKGATFWFTLGEKGDGPRA